MRCGHAECLQNCGERIEASGELGEAMLHEAVPDDQTQWDGGPVGDSRSAEQIDGKVAPHWRPSLGVARRFHVQSTSIGSMSPSALVGTCRLIEIFWIISASGPAPSGPAMLRACRIRTGTRNARLSWRDLQSWCRRAGRCPAKCSRRRVSAPAPLRARSTAVSNARAAPASNRIFILVLRMFERGFEPSGSAAVVQPPPRLRENLGTRPLTPRHNDVTLS